ncbi:unnamed protein product [Larinioides sclopetarius]|uniref:Uncharacterized protein n=1 Tax=Larinioides sclopetarius TaxID=280406 RepID=A0AAV1ZY27_9ARAC
MSGRGWNENDTPSIGSNRCDNGNFMLMWHHSVCSSFIKGHNTTSWQIHQYNKIIFQLAPSLGSHKIVISDTKLMKWLSLKVVSILYYFHQIK